jgi:NADH-quinone oxidoreductase subunit K
MFQEVNLLVPTSYYIVLSTVLFALGVTGVLLRRNANLAFVAFARAYEDLLGQASVFFVITVAAAEVAVGLALIVAIFRTKHSIDIDELNEMEG